MFSDDFDDDEADESANDDIDEALDTAFPPRTPPTIDIWTKLAEPMRDRMSIEDYRARLDAVVPGEWDMTLELLPVYPQHGVNSIALKSRLQILGVIRESTSEAAQHTYKNASDSAFINACKMFGLGRDPDAPKAFNE